MDKLTTLKIMTPDLRVKFVKIDTFLKKNLALNMFRSKKTNRLIRKMFLKVRSNVIKVITDNGITLESLGLCNKLINMFYKFQQEVYNIEKDGLPYSGKGDLG